MSYMIKEIADIAGVSVRTLHHYDDIGLLVPDEITGAGYRIYNDKDIEKLQQILFFKELDFSLAEIKEILENPYFDRKKALWGQRELLLKKKQRIENIINAVDKSIALIEGGKKMSVNEMFKSFSTDDIKDYKEKYAKEVEEKYGNSHAYKESQKKTSTYNKDDWERISAEGQKIYDELSKLMDRDVNDEEVQKLVHQWRIHITNNFYNCTPEIFKGLSEMYVCDERFTANIDKTKKGLAKFLSDAMKAYCNIVK